VGKTHLACALGHIAIRRRRTVHMASAAKLFKRLKAARLDNTLETGSGCQQCRKASGCFTGCLGNMGGLVGPVGLDAADRLGGGPPDGSGVLAEIDGDGDGLVGDVDGDDLPGVDAADRDLLPGDHSVHPG
jgi:hypothetical protein